MVYRTAPFSVTLNDPYPQFQGHAIRWRWISHKQYGIQTLFQGNTNRDLHTPYSTVSCRMILSDLSDLAKYSMTRSVARSLCDSWASCFRHRPPLFQMYQVANVVMEAAQLVLSQFSKKLSFRRETARCFVSINISLCHSRSLKVIRTDTLE